MIRRPFLRPIATVLAVVCLLNGCYAWKAEPRFAASVSQRPAAPVRVRMLDGRQFVVDHPRIVGDSLVGTADTVAPGPGSTSIKGSAPVAIALARIASVETRQVNGGKTVVAVVATVGVLAVGLAVLFAATCTPGELYCG